MEEKHGEVEGTEKKGQKMPVVILGSPDLHQASGWTGHCQGREVGCLRGILKPRRKQVDPVVQIRDLSIHQEKGHLPREHAWH